MAAGARLAPAIAMDADGDFVVAWHGDATDNWEIGARRGTLRSGRGQRTSAPVE